jgi:hypothetical protein
LKAFGGICNLVIFFDPMARPMASDDVVPSDEVLCMEEGLKVEGTITTKKKTKRFNETLHNIDLRVTLLVTTYDREK